MCMCLGGGSGQEAHVHAAMVFFASAGMDVDLISLILYSLDNLLNLSKVLMRLLCKGLKGKES